MDSDGKSGRSLLETLEYLEKLSIEDRPDRIILECTKGLIHLRQAGLQGPERGTVVILKRFRQLGYTGRWKEEDPRSRYLPQSRGRAWAMLFKAKLSGPNPLEAADARERDAAEAFSFLERFKTHCHEDLAQVMSRLADKLKPHTPRPNADHAATLNLLRDKTWMQQHEGKRALKELQLSPSDVAGEDLEEFLKASTGLLSCSQQRHVLMRLAGAKKTGQMPDWRKELITMNPTESGYRLTLKKKVFPCVLPTHKHIIAKHGVLMHADGPTCMAMQGIQGRELQAFPPLAKEPPKRQQNWAGNAFTANVCAAYELAGAVVLGRHDGA